MALTKTDRLQLLLQIAHFKIELLINSTLSLANTFIILNGYMT